MGENREEIIKKISKIFAITRYDLEQRQSLNDLSLNIYSENFFRDILNFIYKYQLENANLWEQNASCIDLEDKKNKILYQVTSTRTKEKILNTFEILKQKKYKNYELRIIYLLGKSKPQKSTIDEIKEKYNKDLLVSLVDTQDLIVGINNLEESKLKELYSKYFESLKEKYTDEISLDLVCRHLVRNKSNIKIDYDDNLGNMDTNKKIELNNLNERIKSKINNALDYNSLFRPLEQDGTMTSLRNLIIEDLYKENLCTALSSMVKKEQYENKSIKELHLLAVRYNLDFNKIINKIHSTIEEKINFDDFNSTELCWIIVSYFFELCDIGVKEDDNAN